MFRHKPFIDSLSRLSALVFAIVALMLLLFGLYFAKMSRMRKGRALSTDETPVLPIWIEPAFYIVLSLVMLGCSIFKLFS